MFVTGSSSSWQYVLLDVLGREYIVQYLKQSNWTKAPLYFALFKLYVIRYMFVFCLFFLIVSFHHSQTLMQAQGESASFPFCLVLFLFVRSPLMPIKTNFLIVKVFEYFVKTLGCV